MQKIKVLITTIEPISGGVPSMLRVIIDYLHQRDYDVTLAYYSPYSINPQLSVPTLKLFQRKPSTSNGSFYGCESVGVGCWLPELEFTHHWLSNRWQQLIDKHSLHMTVSGSCLASHPYVQTNTPFFAWIATDWLGDRADRVQSFPLLRRLIDNVLVKPVVTKIEKKIIASKNLVALSSYTQSQLNKISSKDAVDHILSMPIDTDYFKPHKEKTKKNRICFVGRFSDPRKNMTLFFESIAQVVKSVKDLEVYLIGDSLPNSYELQVKDLGLTNHLKIYDDMTRGELADILPTCDIFVLPSHQEGLCIAAMEAMSCGVPVVSTRCGGPEMFIHNGVNGALVDFSVQQMSTAILLLLSNDKMRLEYSLQARKTIVDQFSQDVQSHTFWTLFDKYCLNVESL